MERAAHFSKEERERKKRAEPRELPRLARPSLHFSKRKSEQKSDEVAESTVVLATEPKQVDKVAVAATGLEKQ